MDILSSCVLCSNPFTPRRNRQKYCPSCIEQSHVCVDCGAVKHRSVRGLRCKKCTDHRRIDDGKTGQWNRREAKPIEQVLIDVEVFGLLPEKQYAFGYVVGVVFGDGCIGRETNRIPHTRSDGTIAYHDSTIYRIILEVTEEVFAKRFASHWAILTGKAPSIMSYTRTNFSASTLKGRRKEYALNLFRVKPGSVLLGRYLTHLKHESDVRTLLRFPPEVLQGIIHGMIDSEGSATSHRRIVVYNKRVELLEVLALMLELLGYSATVSTFPSTPISQLVIYDMDYSKFGLLA